MTIALAATTLKIIILKKQVWKIDNVSEMMEVMYAPRCTAQSSKVRHCAAAWTEEDRSGAWWKQQQIVLNNI
jgi:hypothetical protein